MRSGVEKGSSTLFFFLLGVGVLAVEGDGETSHGDVEQVETTTPPLSLSLSLSLSDGSTIGFYGWKGGTKGEERGVDRSKERKE